MPENHAIPTTSEAQADSGTPGGHVSGGTEKRRKRSSLPEVLPRTGPVIDDGALLAAGLYCHAQISI